MRVGRLKKCAVLRFPQPPAPTLRPHHRHDDKDELFLRVWGLCVVVRGEGKEEERHRRAEARQLKAMEEGARGCGGGWETKDRHGHQDGTQGQGCCKVLVVLFCVCGLLFIDSSSPVLHHFPINHRQPGAPHDSPPPVPPTCTQDLPVALLLLLLLNYDDDHALPLLLHKKKSSRPGGDGAAAAGPGALLYILCQGRLWVGGLPHRC